MKKFLKAASVILIAALLLCFFGCPQPSGSTPENTQETSTNPATPTNPETPSTLVNTPSTPAAPVSGIFSEENAFYMNVEADKAPANGKLTLVKVNDKLIKAGEGVILKSTSATVILGETTQSATYNSILTGSDTATTVTNALVLSNGENGVRFYKYTGSVAAHKAWLTE